MSSSVMRRLLSLLVLPWEAAAPAGGAAFEARVGGAARFSWKASVNSLMRASLSFAPGDGTALISTSSGWVSHGEDSMLRISVETRAFDWA